MSRAARRLLVWVTPAVPVLVILLSVAHGDRSDRPGEIHPTTSRVTQAGLSGPVGPRERPCQGVRIGIRDDLQSAIDRHPPGTTFCLARGTHRLVTPVVPRRGDALIGAPGAVLSGSKRLTDWHREGRVWTTSGFLPPAPERHGVCRIPTCTYAEDVFLDKRRLERVTAAAAVTAGTFHADYRTDTITIGDNPRHHLLEQAVAPGLARATVDNVTVADLVLEEAANQAQHAAVESRRVAARQEAGSGWRILHNEVRLNHGVGVGLGSAAVMTGNDIHHQGQLGFGAWGRGSVITDNEIAFNGTAGFSADWEAGGGKLWSTTRTTLAHNHVHDNTGAGLWADGGAMKTTYAWNRVIDNWGAGIQHELSYDARIVHNLIIGNGGQRKGWAWDAGIQIQSSGGTGVIVIAHNTLRDNANGITLLDSGHRKWDPPRPHGPHVVRNVRVRDNTITMRAGESTGAVEDTGDPRIFTDGHNDFEGNTYHVDALAAAHFVWAGRDLAWAQWRRLGPGHDLAGEAAVLGPRVTANLPPPS